MDQLLVIYQMNKKQTGDHQFQNIIKFHKDMIMFKML